eukprot:scaffold10136_cov126-Isochrysis_galbana.AAC.8
MPAPLGRRPAAHRRPSLDCVVARASLRRCHLAVNTSFGSQFPIRVCDIEALEECALSTYHLMLKLPQQYPGRRFMCAQSLQRNSRRSLRQAPKRLEHQSEQSTDALSRLRTALLAPGAADSRLADAACTRGQMWPAPNVPNAGELLYQNFEFVVLDRPGFDIPKNLPSNFTRLVPPVGSKIVTEDVSSSLIRNRIKNYDYGESERSELQLGHFQAVDGLLTPAVLAHIIRYRLYSS